MLHVGAVVAMDASLYEAISDRCGRLYHMHRGEILRITHCHFSAFDFACGVGPPPRPIGAL